MTNDIFLLFLDVNNDYDKGYSIEKKYLERI